MGRTITTADTRPRPEAREIGKLLEQSPPWGYQDRYSEIGWSHIAEGVLRAQARLAPPPAQGTLDGVADRGPG